MWTLWFLHNISSQNSNLLYWNGILLIWNKNINPQPCIKQWQVCNRFPSLSSIMRVTNVLLLINLNNISNRRPLIVYFASWKRGGEIMGEKWMKQFQLPFFFAVSFLCFIILPISTLSPPKFWRNISQSSLLRTI